MSFLSDAIKYGLFPPKPLVVFAPVLGSTGAAAANVTAIQALLNNGGTIWLTGSGIAYINATLLIYSNTRLIVAPMLQIKMTTGINLPLLVNNAYNGRASTSSVTLSAPTGNSVPVAWNGHGKSVGDYVWISGANQSYYNGIFKVATVPDANNFTYTTLRLPVTNPTGTVVARAADVNITVEGGLWNYDYPNNNGVNAVERHGIILGVAQNVIVRDLVIRDVAKFCVHFGAIRDALARNVTAPTTNSDIVKVYGFAANVRVENISGMGGDDAVSFQTKEAAAFSTYMWTFGDIINCTVDGVNVEQAGGSGLVMLYGSASEYMGGIVIRNVGGAAPAANAVGIYAGYSSSVIDDVLIENVNALALTGLNVNAGGFSLSVNSIQVRDYIFNPSSTTNSAIGVSFGGSVTVVQAILRGLALNSANWLSASAAYLIAQGANIDSLVVEDCEIRTASSGGSTRFLNYSAAAVGRLLSIKNVTYRSSNADNFLVVSSGVTGTPAVSVRDCDIDATAIINTSASINLTINGNRFGAATNGVVRTGGTPTITIAGSGNTLASGSWIVVPSGTPVIHPKSFDVQVDLDVTGITRATGNYCYNTKTTLGTLGAAGPVVCQGTAANSWRLQGDPTLQY